MPYQLDITDLDKTYSLTDDSRMTLFFEKVADWEELWAIADDEGYVIQAKGDKTYISLWPHPHFADDIVRRLMPKNQSVEVDFEFLLEQLIPTLKSESIHVAVFPNKQWEGILLSPEEFESQLHQAMKQFE